jgi:hypothetical protein
VKYLFFLYLDEIAGAAISPEAMKDYMREMNAYLDALNQAEVPFITEGLHPTSVATTVRTQKGQKVITHGPFAETKEQIGGFFLIEVPNLDEAIEWAARCPASEWGTIEIRPVANGQSG